MSLFHRAATPADVLIRAAHVADPREGLDTRLDVLVRDGVVAELGAPHTLEAPPGAELLDGEGRHVFPGFVDPHVHLRVPGQEHKEDIETGTRAAGVRGRTSALMPAPSRATWAAARRPAGRS